MLPVYTPDVIFGPRARPVARVLGLMMVLGLLFALVELVLGMHPAFAEDVVNDVSDPGSATVKVDPLVLSFVVGSLLPLLVGFVTKLDTSTKVKTVLNLVLSVVGGVVAAFVANPDHTLTYLEIATAAIAVYLSSGVTYLTTWRKLGATQALQRTGPIK